jgi:hypothetical protein
MTKGRKERLWGLIGVRRVQGTLGATMEPGCEGQGRDGLGLPEQGAA